jgi:hypothetical protein
MALGILETQVEHVPGTVYVYASDQRRAELLENAQHLKRDKTGRIILVPQPSNDPNDPLVGLQLRHGKVKTLISTQELASLAAGCHSGNPLLRLLPRDHSLAFAGGRLRDPRDHLQANLSRRGPPHSLPPLRCLCGRMAVRGIGKSLGQKTPVSLRSVAHGYQ